MIEEHVNFAGCGKLYTDPPESPRDTSGSIKVSVVAPFDLPAGAVIEAEYTLHGFMKTTATGGRMMSLQAWGKNLKGDGTLKGKLWDLIQKHPEMTRWKVSEIHKRWLRSFPSKEINKAVRELVADGKLVIDPKGSRWDSLWFWTKEKALADPFDHSQSVFPATERQADLPICNRQDGAPQNHSDKGLVGGVSVGVSGGSGVPSASSLVEGSGSFEKVGMGTVKRAPITWRK